MADEMFIMQGIPGSGKSTIAKLLKESVDHGIIFSTDEYWYLNNPDVYDYRPEAAVHAHRWNQQRVAAELVDGFHERVIIDNTNITRDQAKPYITMAEIFGIPWTVVRVDVPVELAIARQADRPEDRQVPEDVIMAMHAKMQTITPMIIPDESKIR